jgi:pimeloyl-ACP methyl ester carboxylesterase
VRRRTAGERWFPATLACMPAPFPADPSLVVVSPDGTPIAVFSAVPPMRDGAPATREGVPAATALLLVHGTGSDHTTWRAVAPELATHRTVHALDRRGRGRSGDGPGYDAGREVDDIVAVAETLAEDMGAPIAVAGHSLGGRLALAASLRTGAIARVAAYESAPGAPGDASTAAMEALLARLEAHLRAGDREAVLATFMTEAAGLPAAELAAFRSSDLWPLRAATAPTIVRELDAALHDEAIAGDLLATVTVPVLQLTGSQSPAWFRDRAADLHRRLRDCRLVAIDGARHAAHHSHPAAFIAALEGFLAG